MTEDDPHSELGTCGLARVRSVVWNYVEDRLPLLQEHPPKHQTDSDYEKDGLSSVLHGLLFFSDIKIREQLGLLDRVARIVHFHRLIKVQPLEHTEQFTVK